MEIDGHDFESILSAFRQLEKQDKPMMIIANTIKGKGVSFMENDLKWHQSALTSREFEIAIGELEKE
jgi:transketolase